jgi:hypothetical protein
MNFPLSWIEEDDFNSCVERLLTRVDQAKQEAPIRSKKNTIDPFLSLLTAFTFGANTKIDIEEIQNTRTITSNISSALGNFHQELLGSVDGWENHDAGYDLECEERKIVAEVKNKHNTMNDSNKTQVIGGLNTAIRQKQEKGWEAYLVIVIPKRTGKGKTQIPPHKSVYEVDGAFFYDLVAKEKNALRNTFDCMLDLLQTKKDIAEEVAAYCKEVRDSIIPDVHSGI